MRKKYSEYFKNKYSLNIETLSDSDLRELLKNIIETNNKIIYLQKSKISLLEQSVINEQRDY